MTDEIREALLNVRKIGLELYKSFRKERFIEKKKKISDTIHRRNLKTFASIHTQKAATTGKRKRQKNKLAQGQ